MKTKISILTLLLMFLFSFTNAGNESTDERNALNGSVKVISTPELQSITNQWVTAFTRINPGAGIEVHIIQPTAQNLLASGAGQLEIVSGNNLPANVSDGDWRIVVARDVVVPIYNPQCPFSTEINNKGISRQSMVAMAGQQRNWGVLLNQKNDTPVTIYMSDDPVVKAAVSKYLIETEINQAAIRLTDAKKILDAIRKDPYAIGFCRITDILANQGKEFATGIALLPIDKNGNGKMDYMEDIYNNPSEFMRGVWIGKYPKALSSEIFAVAPSQPTGAIEVAFLNWVLTGGQEMLTAEGLCSLVNNEKQSQLDKINITRIEPVTAQNGYTVILWIVLILVGLVAISFFIDRVFASYHGGSSQRATTTSTPGHFDDTTVSLPGGIFFDKTHTWAYMEPNGQVKVGLDDFILHATGPVTRIDMRQPGDRIQKGDPLCTIVHKGKQLRMYSPVSGIIKGQNSRLAGDSTILNRSPYSDGWIYEIEPANWLREMGFLTMADKYREWLKVEYTRLRDFIASCLQVHSPGLATVALQDGGSLTDHVLADLEPEVWEDFQTNFIDTKR